MNKKLLLVLLAVLISLPVFINTACSDIKVYTEEDTGKNIQINAGDTFILKLGSNITTGHTWRLENDSIDSDIINLLSSEYRQSRTLFKKAGSGGFNYFTFVAKNSGTSEIVVNYIKPCMWVEDVEPIEVFNLKVTVNPVPE